MGDSFKKPIFIAGCMRSGTTMLAELLGTHPNIIYCPFELKEVWSKAGNVPMSSPRTFDTTCPSLNENDISPGQIEQLTHAFQEQMDIVCKRENKSRDGVFLNKNPHFCNKMPFINGLFPDARFIWIYRDLPSVTASMKKLFNFFIHYWPLKENDQSARCWIYPFEGIPENIDASRIFPGGDVRYFAEYWYENNKAVSDFLTTIPEERFLIIKEEDLTAAPQKIISDCLQFLELPAHKVPKKIIERVDSTRNSLWSERLTHEELKSLYRFVLEKGADLDCITPSKSLFSRYKIEIEECLSGS